MSYDKVDMEELLKCLDNVRRELINLERRILLNSALFTESRSVEYMVEHLDKCISLILKNR